MLLKHGAGVPAENDGDTPLHEAVYNKARAEAELLLDRAGVNAKANDGDTPEEKRKKERIAVIVVIAVVISLVAVVALLLS